MICLSGSSVSIQCDLNNSSKWKAALKSGSNEVEINNTAGGTGKVNSR